MRNRFAYWLVLGGLVVSPSALAWGMNDVYHMIWDVGGKVVGAATDKAVDAVKEGLRDPEAEKLKQQEVERKQIEAFQKAQAEIEARSDLTPLQRERLTLKLRETEAQVAAIKALIDESERRQREERDKIFTVGGLTKATVQASLSMPTVIGAEAAVMVKAGAPKLETDRAMARMDPKFTDNYKFQTPGKQVTTMVTTSVAEKTIDSAEQAVLATVGEDRASRRDAAIISTAEANQITAQARKVAMTQPRLPNAAPAPDAGAGEIAKRAYIEFVDSPSETRRLREVLTGMGFIMAGTREEADIAYRLEGDLQVPETQRYERLALSLGKYIEAPANVEPPATKLSGQIKTGFFKFISAVGSAQGKPLPNGAATSSDIIYKQDLLLVLSRQEKGEKEKRLSVQRVEEGAGIKIAELSSSAMKAMYEMLGLPAPVAQTPNAALIAAGDTSLTAKGANDMFGEKFK